VLERDRLREKEEREGRETEKEGKEK